MFPNFPFTEDVCSTNKWKSSAAAREEIPKGQFTCLLQETAKDYLLQKLKTWIGLILFCLVKKLNQSW